MLVKENKTVEDQKRHGTFIGTVVQHLAHGKLKVYIHGIYPIEFKDNPEKLPTCVQMVPQFGGSFDGNGLFSYPNIGATVLCIFANGDQNLPVMLGAIQGGENAFGQFEIVKNFDEPVSDRHLLTSGKTHVELYESGKLSAIVVDPIRTEAKVKYDTSLEAELSVDAVESRPIADKVDDEEISSINCQLVMDNDVARGTISASTHYFDPISTNAAVSSDDGQNIIVSSMVGEIRNDSYFMSNNDGMVDDGQLSVQKTKFNFLKTNSAENSVESIVHPLTAKVEIKHHYGVDGANYTDIASSLVDSSNYAQRNSSGNIVSSLNNKNECISYINQTLPLQFEMHGSEKIDKKYAYGNSTTGENETELKKSNTSNSIYATRNAEVIIDTLQNLKLSKTDSSGQLVDKHTSRASIEVKCNKGIKANAFYRGDTSGTIGEKSCSNEVDIDAETNGSTHLKLYAHDNQKKPSKNNVECFTYMLPAEQSFQLKIVDKLASSFCEISMEADGTMSIKASKEINIEAPTINVKCKTMKQESTACTQTASTMNIAGSSGDCKIKNVSLLNHVHMETQSGDVVSPQPTKSATASN